MTQAISIPMLDAAKRELACDRCGNRGSIMTRDGLDECPACQGLGRNTATIELLEALTDHATGYVRKVMR